MQWSVYILNAHIVGVNPYRFDRVEFGRLGSMVFERSGHLNDEVDHLSEMIDPLFEEEDEVILPTLWKAVSILSEQGELEPFSVHMERDYYSFYFKRPLNREEKNGGIEDE